MKLIKNSLLFILLKTPLFLFAQQPNNVLVTINDSIYTVADFEHLYNKNLDIIADESQKDINTYFDLYKTYKLRLQHAYDLGLDKLPKVQEEYNLYRKELAEKYFTNDTELKRLLNEALERNKTELNASHILIAVDEFANANDTLKAYTKAIEIRNEILQGMPFENAAVNFSDDLSAKTNKGNLGYFGVFKMVYPFESGAYNTNVGEISLPIRTNFGYHLIKINKKRATPKKKKIAHILVYSKDKNTNEAKQKIDRIYKRLEVGDSFTDTAFHFSEDENSREKGGDLGFYNEGALNIEGISDIVYDLNFAGAYSRPFLSQYGWHIVAVTDIKNEAKLDDLKANFLRKIKSDERSKVLEKDLINHLKEMYHFKTNDENLLYTAKLLNRIDMFSEPKVQENTHTLKTLATFSNQKITIKNLLDHIYSHPVQYAEIKTNELLIKKAFNVFALQKLKETYNINLTTNFPEFAQTLKEYKEGLMLFELLEDKIWKTTQNDTLALQNYYEEHKELFVKPAYFIGEVYVFNKKSNAKTFQKLLKKQFQVNENHFNLVYKYQGTFELKDKRLPNRIDFNKLGKKVESQNNLHYVFLVRDKKNNIVPDFDVVKSQVLSIYQNQFENQFNKQLKQNAVIKTNQHVLNQLKLKYSKKNHN